MRAMVVTGASVAVVMVSSDIEKAFFRKYKKMKNRGNPV
jgi:hypothetical protein